MKSCYSPNKITNNETQELFVEDSLKQIQIITRNSYAIRITF